MNTASGMSGWSTRPFQMHDAQTVRHTEVITNVALADAPHRGVHGQHQCIAPRCVSALRQLAHGASITADVHLHPRARGWVNFGCRGAHIFNSGGREA